MPDNKLFYGDNLEILRAKIPAGVVDLCYIDPPFNSKRTYNQIYNNLGLEDRAQAQAFTDTWTWDDRAIAGLEEIISNQHGRFQPRLIELMKGLLPVLREGSLLAYLISMALRVTEIFRVLKATGTFYLHCDPTASHYLKLVLDAIFCSQGGLFRNEIIWCYRGAGYPKMDFGKRHDTIFRYSKGKQCTFNLDAVREDYAAATKQRFKHYIGNVRGKADFGLQKLHPLGKQPDDWWEIQPIAPSAKERLGYPTQKPETLMRKIIRASSNEGDLVLDAYCGCGTTLVVAEEERRRWIGMDITYQSIALVLMRLEKALGSSVSKAVDVDGIPRDMASAEALAHKRDDRLRKEFEKWAVLTYTNNRAVINDKKGADQGIDARAYFQTGKQENAKIIFQVKSGGVDRGDIATLRGDMGRERAELAILITLEEPSRPMLNEAKIAGQFRHEMMARSYDRIQIVTIREIVEGNERLQIPMRYEVYAAAQRAADRALNLPLDLDGAEAVAETRGKSKRRRKKP